MLFRSGTAACLLWSRYGSPYWFGLDPAEAGVLVSAALMVGVSMVTRPASDGTLETFFGSRADTESA